MKKLLIILFILSLLLNAFFIAKPYLLPDNEKQALQNSLDSCLVVNDSLNNVLQSFNRDFIFEGVGVKAINMKNEYHLKEEVLWQVFVSAHYYSNYPREIFYCYQVINEVDYQMLFSNEDVWSNIDSNKFFIRSQQIDTITNVDEIEISFFPKQTGKYYLRGIMHVPSLDKNNEKMIIQYPMQTEITVVP